MTVNQVTICDVDAAASRLDISVAEHDVEEHCRGYGDGVVWACDYAPADQLRKFLESFGPGMDATSEIDGFLRDLKSRTERTSREGPPDFAGPYWEGFLEGAEDVAAQRDPPLTT